MPMFRYWMAVRWQFCLRCPIPIMSGLSPGRLTAARWRRQGTTIWCLCGMWQPKNCGDNWQGIRIGSGGSPGRRMVQSWSPAAMTVSSWYTMLRRVSFCSALNNILTTCDQFAGHRMAGGLFLQGMISSSSSGMQLRALR